MQFENTDNTDNMDTQSKGLDKSSTSATKTKKDKKKEQSTNHNKVNGNQKHQQMKEKSKLAPDQANPGNINDLYAKPNKVIPQRSPHHTPDIHAAPIDEPMYSYSHAIDEESPQDISDCDFYDRGYLGGY